MDWKQLSIWIIIILVIMMGVFFFKFNDPLLNLQKDVITYLEQQTELRLEIGEIDLWPLNRLILQDLWIGEGEEEVFSVARVEIYYNVAKLLQDPEHWLQSLTAINFERPVFILDRRREEKEDINLEEMVEEIFAGEVLADFAGVKMTADDAFFTYSGRDRYLELRQMDLIAFYEPEQGLDIKARGSTVLDGFKPGGTEIEDLQLDNYTLNLNYRDNSWQGKLQIPELSLEQSSQFFSLTEENYTISEITGRGELLMSFRIDNNRLDSYRGQMTVSEAEAEISVNDIIKRQPITDFAGEISFDSRQNIVQTRDITFNFADNPFSLKGSINLEAGELSAIQIRLSSEEYDLARAGIELPQLAEIKPAGEARISMLITGDFAQPVLDLDIYLPRGKIAEEEISHLRGQVRYYRGYYYLDNFDLQLNLDERIIASGVYSEEDNHYGFEVRGDNIELAGYEEYFDISGLSKLQGAADFDLIINGSNFNLSELTATGNLEIVSPRIGHNKFELLKTDILLGEGKLLMEEGLLQLDDVGMNFAGEIAVNSRQLDLDLDLQNFELAQLENYLEYEIPQLKGRGDFRGYLTGELSDPVLEGVLDISRGQIRENEFSELRAELHYKRQKLKVQGLTLSSRESRLKGELEIDLSQPDNLLAGEINIFDLDLEQIESAVDRKLPLSGGLDELQLKIDGLLTSPSLCGQALGSNLELQLAGETYNLDSLETEFDWTRMQVLKLEKLKLKQGEMQINARGKMEDELDFAFTVDKLELAEILPDIDIAGPVNLSGDIGGTAKEPVIRGTVEIDSPVFRDQLLGQIRGDFSYQDDRLQLPVIIWSRDSGDYQLSGSINNPVTAPELDLNLETENGNIGDLLQLAGLDLPFTVDYNLKGRADISGDIEQLQAMVDFTTVAEGVAAGSIDISGEIAEELNLEFQGKGVEIRDDFSPADFDLSLEAIIDLQGKLSGSIRAPDLEMTTSCNSMQINGITVDSTQGQVSLKEGNKLQLEQKVKTADGGSLQLSGDIDLTREPEISLSAIIDYWPLSIFNSEVAPVLNMDGYLHGEIGIEGELPQPLLQGQVFVAAPELDIGLKHDINSLTGYILLDQRKIELSKFKASYDQSPLQITGNIYPYDRENFWQLQLKARDISYNRGSISGMFDPDIEVGGPLTTPEISGELLAHHTDIILPFTFPAEEDNEQRFFTPEYEVTFLPGEEIFVGNDNIEILVQEGELVLWYSENELDLAGTVRTGEGSFDYYNNLFILEEGRAVFRRFDDNIPDISARAYTYSGGVKINISLDGSASNMLTTFSSQPELDEEEILDLLVQRGGMAEVTGEGDGNVPDFLRRELGRFFQETLQFEVVKNLEQKIKKALELDTMEIDTYDLGWNQEITIYLGKKITDKIELEYMRTFGPGTGDTELENELSLRYYFEEDLHLEGSWLGEDEFRIMLEKSLDF